MSAGSLGAAAGGGEYDEAVLAALPITRSASMLLVVQEHWQHICAFFAREDAEAGGGTSGAPSVAKLELIEHHLTIILDALKTERKRFGAVTLADRQPSRSGIGSSSMWVPRSASSRLFAVTNTATTTADSWAMSLSSSTMTTFPQQLPTAYLYLFTTAPIAADGADLPPVGASFFFLLCQRAAADRPAGSRYVVLHFLSRLLAEVDFPAGEDVASPDGRPCHTLLMLEPHLSVTPLLALVDALRGEQRTGADAATTATGTDGGRLDTARRVDLLRFVCQMAEKAETLPELLPYYYYHDRGEAAPQRLPLLEAALPFLSHDECGVAQREGWRGCLRLALATVLCFAKAPSVAVQRLVAARADIVRRTVRSCGACLLALCKAPDAACVSDGQSLRARRQYLRYLCDIYGFWSLVCLSAPAVAAGLELMAAVDRGVVTPVLLPLVAARDGSAAYARVALVVARLLSEVPPSTSAPTTALATALLRPDDTAAREPLSAATPAGRGAAPPQRDDGDGDGGGGPPSIVMTHVLQRLRRERWAEEGLTGLGATLLLLKTLVIQCPSMVLRYMFGRRLAEQRCGPLIIGGRHEEEEEGAAIVVPLMDWGELTLRRDRAGPCTSFSSSRDVSSDTLSRVLLIESNVPPPELEARLRSVNRHLRESLAGDAVTESPPVDVEELDVVQRLTDMLEGVCDEYPLEVFQQLTELWTCVCALPDAGLGLALLRAGGALERALVVVRDKLSARLAQCAGDDSVLLETCVIYEDFLVELEFTARCVVEAHNLLHMDPTK